MWERLHEELEIVQPRPGRTRVVPPGREAVEAAQDELGFIFPESYRRFVELFGPGELCEFFHILAPGYSSLDGVDIVSDNRDRNADAFGRAYGDHAFVERMICFCWTLGNDSIVWDPLDVTDKESHEHGVYLLVRDPSKIKRMCNSFREFIEDVCLADQFVQYVSDEVSEESAPRVFQPVCVPMQTPPAS